MWWEEKKPARERKPLTVGVFRVATKMAKADEASFGASSGRAGVYKGPW